MTGTVDIEAMSEFLAEPRNAIVGGIRKDGRPHMTPNWFLWDGERFYVSTTKSRAKFAIFSRDARVQLAIDDATGHRYVVLDGTVEISDDVTGGLDMFKALRHKHGRDDQTDEELHAEMVRDSRVLLIITPDKPQTKWLTTGF